MPADGSASSGGVSALARAFRAVAAAGDLESAFAGLSELATRRLGAERAAFWLFEGDAVLRCVHSRSRSAGRDEAGARIRCEDDPDGFGVTGEAAVLRSGARLVAPVWRGEGRAGLFLCDRTDGSAGWTEADRDFAVGVAACGAFALALDERRAADEARARQEQRLLRISENAYDAILEVDAGGVILWASGNVRELIGVDPEALVGRSVFEQMHAGDSDAVRASLGRAMQSQGDTKDLFRYRHSDGSWRWFEGTGRAYLDERGEPRGVAICRDVGERIRAEEAVRDAEAQLSQAQRLEAVGRLAGGIAHDFNNILTAVLGHLDIAIQHADPKLLPELEGAQGAALRAAELTRELLALGTGEVTEPSLLDVNPELERLTEIVRRVIGEDIRLDVLLDPDAPQIVLDPVRLTQVIVNLAVNSRDAMPNGGTLTIETSRQEQGVEAAAGSLRQPGPYLRLDVCDTGEGMDDRTRQRVFDPFFTTKEPGQGTGLGLSTAYQIVRKAGGYLELESTLGRGTRISLWIPEASSAAAAEVVASRAAADRTDEKTGRILLVEDNAAVSRVIERSLRADGHEVWTAAHGREALDLIGSLPSPVDLLISDLVMPVMGGIELVAEVRRRFPHMRVLMISGYSPAEADSALQGQSILRKPFSNRELRSRVAAELRRLD